MLFGTIANTLTDEIPKRAVLEPIFMGQRQEAKSELLTGLSGGPGLDSCCGRRRY